MTALTPTHTLMLAKKNYALDQVPADLDFNDQVLYMLVAEIANDVNSSAFREQMTCEIAGYENLPGKLGYDAKTEERMVEIKPKNTVAGTNRKLNGGGNFTDFTWKREKKYSDDKVQMCVSGFCDGKLVYIMEFDYNSPSFREKIQKDVRAKLPDGDVKGHYCRSASFTWKHWKDAETLRLVWSSPNLDKFRPCMSEPFYRFIKTDLLHENIPLTEAQIMSMLRADAKAAEKAAKKAKREVDRALKKAIKEVVKEAEKAAKKEKRDAERAAKKAAKEAEKAAKKAAKEAARALEKSKK